MPVLLPRWPRVYLNDWIAVDPTFDQFPADAAHIPMRSAAGAQIELVPLVGRLKLEVLDPHGKPDQAYGSFGAVDDISLHVPRGVLYGCLGPTAPARRRRLRYRRHSAAHPGPVLLGAMTFTSIRSAPRCGWFHSRRPFVYDKLTGAEFSGSSRACTVRRATRRAPRREPARGVSS